MGEVLNIRPKTVKRRYKNHDVLITFIPDTREWEWRVQYVSVTEYSDKSDTLQKAQKAAEKHIDKTLKLRGVE